jgi:tetratricopeptide (TPR) repeat protein
VVLTPAVPALAQGSPEGESHFNSGVIHLREGRIDLAVGEFERAVKVDPENSYFRKGLGQAYAANRKWKDAIKQFKEALKLNPYYVDVRNDLGTALILAGKREEGRAELLSARNLGQAYFDEKNYTEAIDWFRTAIDRSATYPDPYIDLARALLATDRLEEAVVLLEAGVEKVPNHAELLYSLGQVYFKVGRFAEARERLEEAMRKDPSGRIGQAAADQLARMPD